MGTPTTPLRITTWNLENFSAHEPKRLEQFVRIVRDNLQCPHVISVQELAGDYRGEGKSHDLKATQNAGTIIEALKEKTGYIYAYCEAPMKRDNQDGAKKGLNVRNGFFYRTDRVKLTPDLNAPADVMDRNPKRYAEHEEAFKHTRKPVIAQFTDRQTDEIYTITNIHLTSRITMDRFLRTNPEIQSLSQKEQQEALDQENEIRTNHRNNQVRVVADANQHIMRYAQGEKTKHTIVCGDFNTEDEFTLAPLNEIGMVPLTKQLPAEQYSRYSHVKGREHIDHVFCSQHSAERIAEVSRYMQPETDMTSDHNPTSIAIRAPHRAVAEAIGNTR